MVLYFVLFAGLVAAKGSPVLPPRPDFEAMIPRTSGTLFARLHSESDPVRREAAALAKYLNRAWDSVAFQDEPRDSALVLLTVVQQFDAALMALNPNPTLSQALERVSAYRPVL